MHELDQPAIYRTEVLAILGALADLVVGVQDICDRLDEDHDDEEAEEGW